MKQQTIWTHKCVNCGHRIYWERSTVPGRGHWRHLFITSRYSGTMCPTLDGYVATPYDPPF